MYKLFKNTKFAKFNALENFYFYSNMTSQYDITLCILSSNNLYMDTIRECIAII